MIAWERIKYLRINLMKNLEINLTKFVLGNLRKHWSKKLKWTQTDGKIYYIRGL